MTKRILLLCLIVAFFSTFSTAQKALCGYDLVTESLEKKYPGYNTAIDKTFQNAKRLGKELRQTRSDETLTIPVVVHVVWNGEDENLSQELIQSQIDVLNEDFNRTNADADNIRPEFADRVGSANVNFELVETVRIQTDTTFEIDILGGGMAENLKYTDEGGSDAWDTEKHLNIWVCKLQPISLYGLDLGQILGFAFPPANLDNWPAGSSVPSPELDGVVIDYRMMGRDNPNEIDPTGAGMPLVVKGRTPTHEVGHYLGLRHTWGDGGGFLGGDSCGEDDGVEDTPNTGAQSNFDCNSTQNTCIDAENDLPDMIENYMDYSAEDCMNSFTQGQIDIIRGVLADQRLELVSADTLDSSIKYVDRSSQLSVYPNPTSGIVHLETTIDLNNFNVQVYNLVGERLERNFTINNNQINMNALNNGVYVVKFQKGKTQLVKKISVLK